VRIKVFFQIPQVSPLYFFFHVSILVELTTCYSPFWAIIATWAYYVLNCLTNGREVRSFFMIRGKNWLNLICYKKKI